MISRDVLINGRPYRLTELIGEGGQGPVWAHPDEPQKAVKTYTNESEFEPAIVPALQGLGLRPLYEPNGTPTLAIPHEVAVDASTNQPCGFTMARVRNAEPLLRIANPRLRIPAVDQQWLTTVALSFLLRICYLHWSGVLVGDVNLNNALVNRLGQVTLIDLDSVQFQGPAGQRFEASYGIKTFQAPEVVAANYAPASRSVHSDVYSAAIVVHQLLRGQHPFDCHYVGPAHQRPSLATRMQRGWWPDAGCYPDFQPPRAAAPFSQFPAELQELFRRCFDVQGHRHPDRRPSLNQFIRCLQRMAPARLREISAADWDAWNVSSARPSSAAASPTAAAPPKPKPRRPTPTPPKTAPVTTAPATVAPPQVAPTRAKPAAPARRSFRKTVAAGLLFAGAAGGYSTNLSFEQRAAIQQILRRAWDVVQPPPQIKQPTPALWRRLRGDRPTVPPSSDPTKGNTHERAY